MKENSPIKQKYERVLDFWFRELSPRQWFGGGAELDLRIGEQFSIYLEHARQGACDEWSNTPRGRLALIVLLDQFSRHIFRGTPAAFAQDTKAQKLAADGIASGMDRQLTFAERHFFYMPLMHAEDMELQALSVEKFSALKNEAEAVLGIAKQHSSIVERFGRFPHRNAVLGRTSTAEEEAFLASKENRFA